MTAALVLRQVSKTYGSGATEVHALRSADLVVNAGELVAILSAEEWKEFCLRHDSYFV